ncbi:MAG: restriction endonuclease subunit S [Fibrobacter sp.]|nr:restriction endonuclease subunit S [Fibrobacter sp.]
MKQKWEYKKLGDVCVQICDGSHAPPQGIEFSDYPMLSSKNIFFDSLNYDEPRFLTKDDFEAENKRTNISDGDVLLTIVGTVGRSCVVVEPFKKFVLQRSVAVLKPNRKLLAPRFLMYKMTSLSSFFEREARGVAQKGIYLKQLSQLPIPVPPLEEQQRIVAELDLLTGIIDKQNAQLKELDTLTQSIFYDMFGDPIENPKGWEVKKLGDVCNVGSSRRIFANEYVERGVPFYRSKEVIEKSKNKPISVELFISQERYEQLKQENGIPSVGDLLITAVGTIGEIWVVDSNQPFYFKDGNIIWLSSLSTLVSPSFFKFSLEKLIAEYKKKMTVGSAYSALTIVNLKKMEILLPPLALQQSFADKIQSIEKQKSAIKASIADTQKLLDYTMDKYFG